MSMGHIKSPSHQRLQLDSTFLTLSAKETEEQFGLRMREANDFPGSCTGPCTRCRAFISHVIFAVNMWMICLNGAQSLCVLKYFSFCCVKYCRLILCKTFENWWTESLLLSSLVTAPGCGGIYKLHLDRRDLILTASVTVNKQRQFVSLLPGFQLSDVVFFFFCFFLFEFAGKNGCRREVERFGFETAERGWTGRWKRTVCASGPAAGWTGKICLCGALWDIPGMAVPWKRAKVLHRVARGEQRRWLLGSSSDGAGIRLCGVFWSWGSGRFFWH